MSGTDPDLDRLQHLLDRISPEPEGMSVAAFDGYVAALIVCPDRIMPSEWLPGVWGRDRVFEDTADAEAAIAMVIGHYNRVALELAERPEDYAPVLGFDPDSGATLWEPWIAGFERAMRLRSDAWGRIALSDDEEASASVSTIVALYDLLRGRSDIADEAEAELDRQAPQQIPQIVRDLNAWTKSRNSAGRGPGEPEFPAGFDRGDPPVFGQRAGCNEPCPCGSGRTVQALLRRALSARRPSGRRGAPPRSRLAPPPRSTIRRA